MNKTIVTDDCNSLLNLIRMYSDDKGVLVNVVSYVDYAKEKVIENEQVDVQIINSEIASNLILNILGNDKYLELVPFESLNLDTAKEFFRIINLFRCYDLSEYYNNSNVLKYSLINALIKEYEKCLDELSIFDEVKLLKKSLPYIHNKEINYLIFNEKNDLLISYLKGLGEEITLDRGINNEYSFIESYGLTNEVYGVCKEIIDKKLRFGDISIYYSDKRYENILESILNSMNINHVFTNSHSFKNHSLYHILNSLFDFALSSYSYSTLFSFFENKDIYVDGVNSINDYYSASRYYSFGKETYIKTDNSRINTGLALFLKKLISFFEKYEVEEAIKLSEFLKDILDFLSAYTKQDLNCLNSLINNLEFLDLKDNLLDGIGKLKALIEDVDIVKNEQYDSISLIYLNQKTIISARKNNYILGLADSLFTLKKKESPVLNDSEIIKCFVNGEKILKTIGQERKNKVYNDSFGYLSNAYICYSCPIYDTLNSIPLAYSLYYLKLKEEINVKEKHNLEYFFLPEETDYENIRPSYVIKEKKEDKILELSLSPSALEEMANCPLKYYYHHDLHLKYPEYKDYDPSSWLKANELGTFVHAIFEEYINEVFLDKKDIVEFNEETYQRVYKKCLKTTLETCPISSEEAYEKECDKILKGTREYLKKVHEDYKNSKWKVFANEFEIKKEANRMNLDLEGKKIVLHVFGFVDRIDYYDDEEGFRHYRIIDYKTGSHKRKQNEINEGKTFQYYLYKMALTKYEDESFIKGTVDEFIYVFPFEREKNKMEIKCPVNIEMPESLKEAIKEYYVDNKRIKEFDSKENPCVYCDYKECCIKAIEDLKDE